MRRKTVAGAVVKPTGLRGLHGSLAVTGMLLAVALTASPALADEFGYLNCAPNSAPYATVTTQSHANGTTYHTQRSGSLTKQTYFVSTLLETRRYNAGWTINSSSTIHSGLWLYSASRYCQQ